MTSRDKVLQLDEIKAKAPVLPRQANVLLQRSPFFDFMGRRLFDLEGQGAAAG
ncbi:hypothetical protein QYG89_03385 [Bacillus sp. B190/17]|uniref:Uncharacterized protein n=1 Tax=Bacillus lumedeiriae TaxID=3058829 RepID=A0ABW8I5J1_9BACI